MDVLKRSRSHVEPARVGFLGVVAIGITLSGCTSTPTSSGTAAPSLHGAAAEPAPSRSAQSEKAVSHALPDPAGALTLKHALEVSLARSPKLRTFHFRNQHAEALELQAGLWNNPVIEAEIENLGGSGEFSGVDAAETTLSLAQTLPLGRDIARRRELAGHRTQLTSWDYEAARLDVMGETTKRFVEALAADRRLALAQQELELAEATEEVAKKRVEAGDASPVELTRIVVPVVTGQVALKRAERIREAAYRRLSLMWDGRGVTFDQVVGDLEEIPPAPAPDVVVRHINSNPRVARWATEIGERVAQRRLAEAEAMPDLTARVGVKRANQTDDTALVIGLSLPLPLFDRRQGEILAARRGEMAARERQRQTELRIESMLSTAYAELLAAQDEAVALRERALPAADSASEATRQAFAEGKLPFLDVLDAQRTLFELQRRYLDVLVAYHEMTAEVELLIGKRLTDLTDSPDNQGEQQ